MIKSELNEKWGKYCDANQLVDDTTKLLYTNGIGSTEHGVCSMLDVYFQNKEPLIKWFSQSGKYIGDMRIAIKVGLERDMDSYAIYDFCHRFVKDVEAEKAIIKYEDDAGKTLSDYFLMGRKAINVKDLTNDSAIRGKIVERKANISRFNNRGETIKSERTLNEFRNSVSNFASIYSETFNEDRSFYDVKIKKGTKTSRAFNKVCCHYGIDKTEKYNKLFAKYADMVTPGVRELYFIISLNPLDYLTMSCGESWKSCHHISGGGWRGGCMSYMLDTTSIITFVVKDLSDKIHESGKIYRNMFHYNDSVFVQNRIYPQSKDGATDLYTKFAEIMMDTFSEIMTEDTSKWEKTNVGEYYSGHINETGVHYKDLQYHKAPNVFAPFGANMDKTIEVGHRRICVKCGNEIEPGSTSSSRLNHNNC